MVTVAPLLTSKTRLAELPLMVNWLAPGPSMSRFLVISSAPLFSAIVWPTSLWSKTMVDPGLAAPISVRSVPLEPSSAALVTVKVLRTMRASSASSPGA